MKTFNTKMNKMLIKRFSEIQFLKTDGIYNYYLEFNDGELMFICPISLIYGDTGIIGFTGSDNAEFWIDGDTSQNLVISQELEDMITVKLNEIY